MTEGELLARQPDAQGGVDEAASREALEIALRLQRAADALISARTPEEVLDSVLTEGVRAAEARGGLIATLSDDGEWLDVVASRGYDNRYVADGSLIPCGIVANPALTVAALAERNIERIMAEDLHV